MKEATMNWFANWMDGLSIPFDFMEWKSKPPDRYFVGEPNEAVMTTMEEDGRQDSTLMLRGFSRLDGTAWRVLHQDAETIRKNLPQTAILPDGTGVAVFYAGATPVPTGDAQLKSIKINLDIKEWSVN